MREREKEQGRTWQKSCEIQNCITALYSRVQPKTYHVISFWIKFSSNNKHFVSSAAFAAVLFCHKHTQKHLLLYSLLMRCERERDEFFLMRMYWRTRMKMRTKRKLTFLSIILNEKAASEYEKTSFPSDFRTSSLQTFTKHLRSPHSTKN